MVVDQRDLNDGQVMTTSRQHAEQEPVCTPLERAILDEPTHLREQVGIDNQ